MKTRAFRLATTDIGKSPETDERGIKEVRP